MKPTISLLISTYNREDALSLTLTSVLNQRVLPDEIVIADDGSRAKTKDLIVSFRKYTTIPILHVWHEDLGFRLSTIRNKAIAQLHGDYIIQIDGDVVLNRYFVKDHIEMIEKNYFVCGSRVKLSRRITQLILDRAAFDYSFYRQELKSMFNGFRSKILRGYLAKRYAKGQIARLRGCNMAFWKEDLIKVNGYNDDLISWGHEDSELAYRLVHAGVNKKFLKMGGVLFHLWHKSATKDNETIHREAIQQVINRQSSRCKNGLDKYL